MRRAGGSALLVAALAALGCDAGLGTPPVQPGIEAEAVNWSVDPCDDFYQFACGNWARWHAIAPDDALRKRSYEEQDDLTAQLYRLVTDDAYGRDHTDDPEAAKIGDYYNSCRTALDGDDTTAPLLDATLEGIAQAATLGDLAEVVGFMRANGRGSALVGIGVQENPDAPTQHQLAVWPGAVGLPRAYFVDADKARFRDAYAAHVDALAGVVGAASVPGLHVSGQVVLRIETALATAAPEDEVWRDPRAVHHPTPVAEAGLATPALDWGRLFSFAGVPDVDDVDVAWPPFLAALNELLRTTPLDEIKGYLAWRAIESAADALGRSVQDLEFDFHSRLFYGRTSDYPVYWRCFNNTKDNLGFALSRPFVARVFDDARREDASRMIEAIRAGMKEVLTSASWLDEPTRAEALTKLGQVVAKVGFPDEWPSYDDYLTSEWVYLDNIVGLRVRSWTDAVSRLGKTVDRSRWYAPPLLTNAFYGPSSNDITFTAAILQPPFFDAGRSASMNYGSIGAVMGRELTHGFDDSGRLYDGLGTLRDWWSPTVAEEFERRAQCLVAQFDAVRPLPGAMVSGARTLGENIADLGGLELAYRAFHAPDGGKGEGAPGYFSPDQQFFIAYAQGWCEKARPAYLRTVLESDAHAPWSARINGVVANMPAFARAFQCREGAPLAPVSRCQVW